MVTDGVSGVTGIEAVPLSGESHVCIPRIVVRILSNISNTSVSFTSSLVLLSPFTSSPISSNSLKSASGARRRAVVVGLGGVVVLGDIPSLDSLVELEVDPCLSSVVELGDGPSLSSVVELEDDPNFGGVVKLGDSPSLEIAGLASPEEELDERRR